MCHKQGSTSDGSRFQWNVTLLNDLQRHPNKDTYVEQAAPGNASDIEKKFLNADDETTAIQLHEYLTRFGISLSYHTVLRSQEQLGWTFRGSAFCQLIRDANKQKRLQWALQHCNDRFEDVVFTDESSVQIETHCKRCYRKKGGRPRN